MHTSSSSSYRRICRSFVWCLLSVGLFLVSGCADTALYTINIRYEQTKVPPAAEAAMKKRILTIATFQDKRTIDDPLKVGYVLRPDGRKIFILPENKKTVEAVTDAARDYFYKAGYSVSGEKPEWDLQEGTINPAWGDVVLGGVINKMEIVCDDSKPLSPVRTYSAVVNLGVTIADVAGKRILYKTSVESNASFKDVSFSIDKLQSQLNSVLSDVLERLFTGSEFLKQLQSAATK